MVTPFVGRASVVADLRQAIDGAAVAGPAVVLLSGEPGIGKSTLAREALDYAVSGGSTVAWGSCWDADGAPPFWPWHQVLRSIGTDLGTLAAGADTDRPGVRFRLFAAVLEVLSRQAGRAPTVVVLDDLHWADAGSLRLLTFLARQLRQAPIVLLGTYRTIDPAPSPALREAVADLAGVAVGHELGGLTSAEIGELLAVTVGATPAEVVRQVHRRTGGNPFFVREVASTAGAGGVPRSVQAALGRRLDALPADTRRLLTFAALIGPAVPAALLDRVGDEVPARATLEPAIVEGLLLPDGDTLRFAHDLIREVAGERLEPDRRPVAHARIARALHASGAGATEVGRHALLARPVLEDDQVVSACAAAAREAADALAYESATRWWRQAVQVAGRSASTSLRLDLADAARRSGDHDEARAGYLSVGRTAAGSDLARAALGLHVLGTASESSHAPVIDLLTRALADAADREPTERARVRAALARELADGVDRDRHRAAVLVDEAVREARAAGDPATLAFCLFAAHDVGWGPGTAATRLALADEMAQAAGDDPELRFEALLCRFVAEVDLGDPAFEVTLRDLDLHARTHRLPRQLFLVRSRQAMVADLHGDRITAGRLRTEADDLAAMIADPDRVGVRSTQLMVVAMIDRGPAGVGDLDAAIGPIAPREFEPEMRAIRAIGRGRPDEAAAILRAAPSPLERSRYRWRALAGLALSAEVAIATDAADLCADLFEAMTPFADEVVDIGGAAAVLGPAAMYLGLLADRLGRPDAAEAHLRTAAAIALRIGAPDLRRRCVRAAAGSRRGVFRFETGTWTLTFAGRTASTPDAKGMHDLARLLRSPGREIPAIELLAAGGAAPAGIGADEVLDATARAAYRARLDALDAALDEAGAAGRPAPGLAEERAALVAELSRAAGFGGRARRLGDPVERARSTVTARIRDALNRLDRQHPELATHLRAAVTTGRTCAYRPEPPVLWEL